MEEWRAVVGFEGKYEVSDHGRVRSLPRPKTRGGILKPWVSRGYEVVTLDRNTKRKVHLVVAEAFLGPRPEGLVTRHLNGDQTDNRAKNLAYGTHAENNADTLAYGGHAYARRTHCSKDHEYTPENTIWFGPGRKHRKCRTCHRETIKLYMRRKRAAARSS